MIEAELTDELSHVALPHTGKIPTWLSGTLIRNGPVKVTVNGQSNLHWFDGLAMLHAFSFNNGEVHYTNKFLRTDAYHKVFKEGSLDYTGFAIDPCRSLFKRFLTSFFTHTEIPNANINVAKFADQYVALTEIPLPVKFDPITLQTLGLFQFNDSLPKEKSWESAHPHYDLYQKKTLNYLIEFGRKSFYILYYLNSSTREIIAKIPVEKPSYMHSFSITQNTIILTEYPLVVKPLSFITSGKAFIKNFTWEQKPTKWTVINKKNGTIQQFHSHPFFAFHHANAFEQGDEIIVDIVTYVDATIITSRDFYYGTDALTGNYRGNLRRFTLSLTTEKISSEVLLPNFCEFPRINESFDGRPYSHLYLTTFPEKDISTLLYSNGLMKANLTTKSALHWSEPNCSPGEPVFIPLPNAKKEDEGIILSVVMDQNNSFLLILDAKSFKEIGRAKVPHLIPSGLHGKYLELKG